MTILDDFDPIAPEVIADPYPWLDRVRAEGPVSWLPSRELFIVTGHAEVSEALHNPTVFSSELGYAQLGQKMSGQDRDPEDALGVDMTDLRMLISTDPPVHTDMRRIVTRAFTPRAISRLEPRLREVCRDMVAELGRNLKAGTADLVPDLAAPFPVIVIAELLGVPAERRLDFRRWSDNLSGTLGGDADMEVVAESGAELFGYMAEAVARAAEHPGDDLISRLVSSMDNTEDPLTADEITLFAILLLAGGNETTSNLIGNAVNLLTQRPDIAERVWSDPEQIPKFVEEVLRYDPPIQGFLRGAREQTELGGVTIPEGGIVLLSFAGANRDPRHFENPDEFDMDRDEHDHLSFGHGVHFCLGATLARNEGRICFETLVEAGIELRAGEGAERTTGAVLRGFNRFPLVSD